MMERAEHSQKQSCNSWYLESAEMSEGANMPNIVRDDLDLAEYLSARLFLTSVNTKCFHYWWRVNQTQILKLQQLGQ